ncbi:MAG: HEAT repeat domain-containing protein, partial [Desulfuromonadales bacterium]|nr:HEAT repeat domain-containing protein [Desulfuromonadales bacterium]
MESIGELVRIRTAHLPPVHSELASRGLSDAARLETDPELLRQVSILRDALEWEDRIKAWEKLREMGPTVRGWERALRGLIREADGWGRIFAAESLAWHACSEGDAIPVLLVTLESTLEMQRYDWSRMACGAIGKYPTLPRPLTDQAVPTLTEALRADDLDVCGYAALALGNWGAQSRPALVELANLYDGAGDQMRAHYLEVMRKIDPGITDALDALDLALDSSDPAVRARATASVGQRDAAAGRLLDSLLPLARDEDPEVRRNLALTLGQMGTGLEGVETALRRLADDGEPVVRLATAYALARLGIDSGPNLQRLRRGLKNGSEPQR